MNNAFRADALAFAVEAEVKDFLIWVFSANFVARNAAHQGRILIVRSIG